MVDFPIPINNVFTSALSGNQNVITRGLVGIGLLPPSWGIFESKGGRSVVTYTTVKSLDYRNDWNVADYPMERGAFESYNKVSTPYEARFTFVSGGFQKNQDMINSILAIAGDLKKYNVVMPEKTFLKANITHLSFRRINPVGLVAFDVGLTEIREEVQSELSQTETRDSSGAATTDGGTVNPATTSPADSKAALGQVPGASVEGSPVITPDGPVPGASVEGSPVIPPTQVPTFQGVDSLDAGTPVNPGTSVA